MHPSLDGRLTVQPVSIKKQPLPEWYQGKDCRVREISSIILILYVQEDVFSPYPSHLGTLLHPSFRVRVQDPY